MQRQSKQIVRRRRGAGGALPANLLYAVNGLAPVLVMDFTRQTFYQNDCGQYEVNGLQPALVMDFSQGDFRSQEDCL